MDPRLLSASSRRQFNKTINAAKRYKAEAVRSGDAEMAGNTFKTRPWDPLLKAQLREGQTIADTYGAQTLMDPNMISLLSPTNNFAVADLGLLQDMPSFYG